MTNREKFTKKLEKKRKEKRKEKAMNKISLFKPKYDSVYFEGLEWLDSL